MNSIIVVAHLLNPLQSPAEVKTTLIEKLSTISIEEQLTVCVETDCEVVARPRGAAGSAGGEVMAPGSENPAFYPRFPKPETNINFEGLDKIIGGLKSMTSIEAGFDIEYRHKNPATGEETELKIKVNGSLGKASGN